ncbi:MAG: hypothetical protein KC414_05560 [Romboutsia sp.]|nr:hypothetical protein [Romboutsia sp.]
MKLLYGLRGYIVKAITSLVVGFISYLFLEKLGAEVNEAAVSTAVSASLLFIIEAFHNKKNRDGAKEVQRTLNELDDSDNNDILEDGETGPETVRKAILIKRRYKKSYGVSTKR